MLGGGGLHADSIRREIQAGGQILLHRGNEGGQLGGLGNDGDISLHRTKTMLRKQADHMAKQRDGGDALVCRVAVGEMLSDVTKGSRTQHGIHQRVNGHVGVAVAVQAKLPRNLHPAQDQCPPGDQTVDIISDAESQGRVGVLLSNQGETKVTIYGSKEVLQNIEYLPIELDVSNLQENKDYKVELVKPNGVKAISVDSINVSVSVTDKIKEKNLDVNIDVRNLSDKYSVQGISADDILVTVNVKGAPSVIEALDASDVNAYIDLSEYKEGTYEVEVNVEGTDPKVSYLVKTKKVKIKISKK